MEILKGGADAGSSGRAASMTENEASSMRYLRNRLVEGSIPFKATDDVDSQGGGRMRHPSVVSGGWTAEVNAQAPDGGFAPRWVITPVARVVLRLLVLYGALLPATFVLLRGKLVVHARSLDTWDALGGDLVAMIAYGVVWRRSLSGRPAQQRIVACTIVAAGAIFLSH